MAKCTFLQDFKDFAMKGNVVDMAVGVIIGGAFGKIVTSIVNNIIMPPVGVITGGVDFTDLKVTLKEAVVEGEEVVSEAVTLNYGQFIQDVVDFLIIAFCIFLMVKGIAKLNRKKEEAPAPEPDPKPSNEEVLLTEIRDLLKKKA
ncbi:MAG: large-conductance mechanosensitive channel protein MscL [Bacteroidaceae bacterium]|jgi:large conductance mechanosensitive channel|nr:large-conductance mechanosensitive channel protein MscL [Bacteroidaceae bacterium]MBQ2074067.1 large-conductance mechanosensitive channel protein MscL [Bacteroidaceae bacterium]